MEKSSRKMVFGRYNMTSKNYDSFEYSPNTTCLQGKTFIITLKKDFPHSKNPNNEYYSSLYTKEFIEVSSPDGPRIMPDNKDPTFAWLKISKNFCVRGIQNNPSCKNIIKPLEIIIS